MSRSPTTRNRTNRQNRTVLRKTGTETRKGILPVEIERVLVTGATGFIGHRLCGDLCTSGYNISAAVRDVEKPLSAEAKPCLVKNMTAKTKWDEALKGVDYVIHLAARVHVMKETEEDPEKEFNKTNCEGTFALAKQAAEAGVKRFIFISTVKVFGEYTTDKPFSSKDEASPKDAYSISKYNAEKALFEISEQTGMEVVVLRPPLVYGPRVKGNFISLIKAVNSFMPLPLGCVKNRRSIIYSGNLTSAIIECIKNPEAAGKVLVPCDNKSFSTAELAKEIAKALGKTAFILPVPVCLLKAAAKITGKTAIIDRLTQSLEIKPDDMEETIGWSPPFPTEEGLKDTKDWFCSLET